MNHDVYICYDEKDEQLSDELYRLFENNGLKPWTKSRDMASGDSIDKVTHAIGDSECFVLILDKKSKETNYILTELDIAFSGEIPIVIFNLDDEKPSKKLEFLIRTQKVINSFPNTKSQLKTLVRETSKTTGKPVQDVKIDSSTIRSFEDLNPKRNENRIKKYVAVAIPLAAIVILAYLFVILPAGQNTTSDGVFAMNMTNVEANANHYIVHGESYNLPSDSEKYFMNIKFFDKNDAMVFEVNSTADEFKKGIIWQGDLPSNNVTHVGFKLIDLNNKVLSQNNYTIS